MATNLGAFIRAHRERIKPEDVGLPQDDRRRTPGLRREELAHLCRVSTTWLTWLEQGRPVSASAKMLGRLAGVLRLSPAERNYLFRLADKVDQETDPAGTSNAVERNDARAIVDAIKVPAYVLDRQWNAVASNKFARDLFAGWLDQANGDPDRNLLRYMFLQPAARNLAPNWPDRAKRLVAEFRADCGKLADAFPIKNLVDELSERSAEFRKLWAAHDVADRTGGIRKLSHPNRGQLAFNQLVLQPLTRPDLKLVMLFPAG
jgi:transcriptional regulator with XRE-family HTH domain